MHFCRNTAIKGLSWPNFWANLASFSLQVEAIAASYVQPGATGSMRLFNLSPDTRAARGRGCYPSRGAKGAERPPWP
jgi:hypothetical protein